MCETWRRPRLIRSSATSISFNQTAFNLYKHTTGGGITGKEKLKEAKLQTAADMKHFMCFQSNLN